MSTAAAAGDNLTTPILLDVRAAARHLSVSRSTLYQLLKAGEIQSVKIGSLRRISLTALRDYVARQAVEYRAV